MDGPVSAAPHWSVRDGPEPAVLKRLFDAVDRRVSPRVDDLARDDDVMAAAAALHRLRGLLGARMERASRRLLHLLNLPAGSDVNRLLEHIARLEQEVAGLRQHLTDRELRDFLDELADEQRSDGGGTE